MTPVEALERAVHYLERSRDNEYKTRAFVRALDVVKSSAPGEIERRHAEGSLTALDGIGDSTATVIAEALAGQQAYLDHLAATTQVPVPEAAKRYRDALRGDLHLHSTWSDGGASVDAMVRTAIDLGHEYMVITDHSPRLTVAHGLSAERLAEQVAHVAELNERYAPFRLFTGIEVDILEDGSLDHSDDVLAQLDIVVASVHNKLRMPHDAMTERMLSAVRSPHVDILGHCTGQLVGKREPSSFDADAVFAACTAHRTAVEINSRPDRLDPPADLLAVAIGLGCWFSIDSDAHSTGQLEWQPLGCERAAEAAVPLERVINTLPADALARWVAG